MFTFTHHKWDCLHYLGRTRDTHMHMHALSFLTLLVSMEAISHSLQNPTSVKYATWQSTLTFSFEGKDGTVHSQEREQADFNINSGLLVSTQSSSRPSYFVTREKARGGANGYLANQLQGDGRLEERGCCSLYMPSHWFSCIRILIVRLTKQ